jgi:hypothetical protein
MRPDNGTAFQKYNPRTNKWCWDFVGSQNSIRSFTKADVLKQLKPSRFCHGADRYAPGYYRFVFVRQWLKRVGGWRAVITKASPAVRWPQ